MNLSDKDIALIRALQGNLPAVERPFEAVARASGMGEDEAIAKVREWKEQGMIRRFGALVAHRRAGVAANGMVVWDVPDDKIEEIGVLFSKNPKVSHCYARPRFDGWPYRLYTMIHGKTREEVEAEAKELAGEAGLAGYRILFSTREFKKSDTQLFCEDN